MRLASEKNQGISSLHVSVRKPDLPTYFRHVCEHTNLNPFHSPQLLMLPLSEDDMAGAVQEKIVELSQLPSSAAVAGDYGSSAVLGAQNYPTKHDFWNRPYIGPYSQSMRS